MNDINDRIAAAGSRVKALGWAVSTFAVWEATRHVETMCAEGDFAVEHCRDEMTMARESGEAADEFLSAISCLYRDHPEVANQLTVADLFIYGMDGCDDELEVPH